jgi:singapore isolate B (sub-type 7) whole genome shotgun sequence assembly, scaffold_15
MELLTPAQQVERMMTTDVLIGVLGSGFANSVFMLPGSVAVSFSPPFVGGFFFSTMAEYSQIRYIPVFNYSIIPPKECTGLLGQYGEMKSDSEYCLSTLYTSDIYFNIGTISSILRQALTHLRIHKFRTQ